jgi:hypothetical protein
MLVECSSPAMAYASRSPIPGIWSYFRTAVLDLGTSKLIFQYDGHFGDDLSISPDGHLVAARHEERLASYNVP